MANNGFRWSVGGVPVNQDDHVSCESPDGSCSHHYGRLRDNVECPPAALKEIARLRTENERLKANQFTGCAAPLESIVANLKPLATSFGLIEPSPLRCGGIHLDAPAGSVITITLPKD